LQGKIINTELLCCLQFLVVAKKINAVSVSRKKERLVKTAPCLVNALINKASGALTPKAFMTQLTRSVLKNITGTVAGIS
jgi:hypothetical protein